MPLDPNDAPAGYVAITNEAEDCQGCALAPIFSPACERTEGLCLSIVREDGQDVIFVKRPEAQAAPAAVAEPNTPFTDPRVQIVYGLLADSEAMPPDGQHWEGWVARRIVDALAAAPAAAQPVAAMLVRDLAAVVGVKPLIVCRALESLGYGPHSVNMAVTPEAVAAIERHFAAQPVAQEPVACLIRSRSYTPAHSCHDSQIHYGGWSEWEPATLKHGLAVTDPARNNPKVWDMRPLYTTPPALVGLSDEQIMHLWFAAEPTPDGRPASWNYARAVERAMAAANGMTLREGGNG